jgi:hypothetical protein
MNLVMLKMSLGNGVTALTKYRDRKPQEATFTKVAMCSKQQKDPRDPIISFLTLAASLY